MTTSKRSSLPPQAAIPKKQSAATIIPASHPKRSSTWEFLTEIPPKTWRTRNLHPFTEPEHSLHNDRGTLVFVNTASPRSQAPPPRHQSIHRISFYFSDPPERVRAAIPPTLHSLPAPYPQGANVLPHPYQHESSEMRSCRGPGWLPEEDNRAPAHRRQEAASIRQQIEKI